MIDGGSIKERQAHYTPGWVVHALYERHFSHLGRGDTFFEPTCGDGGFLIAVPPEVNALGCEIDAAAAAQARARTGRTVIHGDVCTAALPANITAIMGNPPFRVGTFTRILRRCHEVLPKGGTAAFIMPSYAFSPARVEELSNEWSITSELLPRELFGRLPFPLSFCRFIKDRRRLLVGFALYPECFTVANMRPEHRELLAQRTSRPWRDVVHEALTELGGTASLAQIYRAVEPRRATDNRFWQEKVRQILRQHFVALGTAMYALPVQQEFELAA